MDPSPPGILVPQEQEMIYSIAALNGKSITPPALIQREVNASVIQLNSCDDNGVFSKVITYQYGTRTDPRLHPVVEKVRNVLNALYSKVVGLEERNAALQNELDEVQNALDGERRKNMRRQDYDYSPQHY